MLNELFFSLVGFTGDVIIETDETFKVKDGFDLLREAEKDQLNKIAPLGWYYVNFDKIVQKYDLSWNKDNHGNTFHIYHVGMVQGVADLLEEYIEDVSYLEKLVLTEGPIPLSQVLQHLQKVNELLRLYLNA